MTTSYKQPVSRKQDKRSVGLMPGDRVTGKWNHRVYRIVRLLGQGANGVVYLVQLEDAAARGRKQEGFALKIGFDTVELQSEINALQALEALKPASELNRAAAGGRRYFFESDDAEINGEQLPFYIMQYVSGKTLSKFISRQGFEWCGIIGEKLLQRLNHLHQNQFVFGDLKPDNVMVGANGEVSLIDYGGLTREGDGIRQFTEWYDRGYWNAGSRTANYHYDLFAFAVMMIHLRCERVLHERLAGTLPQLRDAEILLVIASECKALQCFRPWLERAIHQRFPSTEEALREWRIISRKSIRMAPALHKPTPKWLRWSFVASAILLLVSLFYMFISSSPDLGL